ncbi:MAG TPA: addiction module antidote protein [Rudaea sp.]|jgi:probable addiction module antidote protein|nr:addiction module antidote protein [Rudaea sp.]
MAIKLYKFDAADYIRSLEDVEYYLEAALEENDPDFFKEALRTVARSRGMQAIAQNSQTTRAGLYKALSSKGNPEFATIHRVVNALGYRFAIHRLQPKKATKKAASRAAKKAAKKATLRRPVLKHAKRS